MDGEDRTFKDPRVVQQSLENKICPQELFVVDLNGDIKRRVRSERRGKVVGECNGYKRALVTDICVVSFPDYMIAKDELSSRVANWMVRAGCDSKDLKDLLISHVNAVYICCDVRLRAILKRLTHSVSTVVPRNQKAVGMVPVRVQLKGWLFI